MHHAKPEENPHFSRNSPSLFIFLVWVGSCNPTQAFLVFRSATTIALCFTNWTPGKSLSITTYEGRILLLTCSTISPWSVRYGTGVELCRQSCVCDMCWKKQYSFCERAGREDWRHAEKGNGILYGLVPSRFSTRKREVLVPRNFVLCRRGEQGTAQGCLGVGHEHLRLIKRQTAYLPKQSLIILFSYCEEWLYALWNSISSSSRLTKAKE